MSKITEEKPVLSPEKQRELNDALLYNIVFPGSTKKVEYLLSQGADVNARYSNGQTALMMAASWDNKKMLIALIKAGADVNTRDNNGQTALIHAAIKVTLRGDTDIVTALIEAGADVYVKDNYGKTVFDIEHPILTAHKKRLNEIAIAIEQESTRTTPLSDDKLKSNERRKLVIDATNFNKDNIIEALVYKLAKDEVTAGRPANAAINNLAEEQSIQALRNDIHNTPERLQAITESLNKALEKYQAEREHDPRNRIPFTSGKELNPIHIPAEITATIASYLPEEQIGDKRSERGALRVAALSNNKSRDR